MGSSHTCTAIAAAMINPLSVSTLLRPHLVCGALWLNHLRPTLVWGASLFYCQPLPSSHLRCFSTFSTLGNCCFLSSGFVGFRSVGHAADSQRRWMSDWSGMRVPILRSAGGPQSVCRLLRRLFSFLLLLSAEEFVSLVGGGCFFVLAVVVGSLWRLDVLAGEMGRSRGQKSASPDQPLVARQRCCSFRQRGAAAMMLLAPAVVL